MFSGIIEETGRVHQAIHQLGGSTITLKGSLCLTDLKIGDSIAVNGICLTVCKRTEEDFTVEVMPETLNLTTLGQLKLGDAINLERAITAQTRIGGHWVQGHGDGTTTISKIQQEGCSLKVWFDILEPYYSHFIPKGFITIDGMSLTIVDVTNQHFSVCLIPHTQEVTIAKNYCVGHTVNVEIDHITKTVISLLKSLNNQGALHGLH